MEKRRSQGRGETDAFDTKTANSRHTSRCLSCTPGCFANRKARSRLALPTNAPSSFRGRTEIDPQAAQGAGRNGCSAGCNRRGLLSPGATVVQGRGTVAGAGRDRSSRVHTERQGAIALRCRMHKATVSRWLASWERKPTSCRVPRLAAARSWRRRELRTRN